MEKCPPLRYVNESDAEARVVNQCFAYELITQHCEKPMHSTIQGAVLKRWLLFEAHTIYTNVDTTVRLSLLLVMQNGKISYQTCDDEFYALPTTVEVNG